MIYSFSEYIRYLIFAAPVLIFAILAQIRVKSTYSKYSKIRNSRGLTGAAAAQLILKHYGITDVRIVPCAGELTDNYSPNEKMIRLSEKVYNSTSVAAVGRLGRKRCCRLSRGRPCRSACRGLSAE